jgi:hypothetical protein
MMQRTQWISLAVVLLLLASFATASAECAWVLWTAKWDDQVNDYRYRYVDSFTTKPGCDDEAAFRNRNIKEARERDRPRIVPMGILQCVPDTIDPRGPKGR